MAKSPREARQNMNQKIEEEVDRVEAIIDEALNTFVEKTIQIRLPQKTHPKAQQKIKEIYQAEGWEIVEFSSCGGSFRDQTVNYYVTLTE